MNGHEAEAPVPSREELVEVFGGDEALMEEIVSVFLDERPSMGRAIGQALASQDQGEIARAAHTIKGAIGYFGDSPAVGLARSLEQAARDGADPATLSADLQTLDNELGRLAEGLRSLLTSAGQQP